MGGYPVKRRNGFARELGGVGIRGGEIAAEKAGGYGSHFLGLRLRLCGLVLRNIGTRGKGNGGWRFRSRRFGT